MNLSSTRN